ncbi:MAG: cytidylate kinase [Monoraphidium minutum]|nr:MAG: cytidylate kinase [Monoraphidium minutum]
MRLAWRAAATQHLPHAKRAAAGCGRAMGTRGGAPLPPPLVVAIDGPAASGKGTLARLVAEALGLAHMDTGLLYRRVGLAALERGVPLTDEPALTALAAALPPPPAGAAADSLRSEAAGQAASQVSALPGVRAALLEAQRRFARAPPPPAVGAVLDGRDVGTVVCPGATAKLFVTASAETRAARRLRELRDAWERRPEDHGIPGGGGGAAGAGAGAPPALEAVLASMRERDARDAGRAAAPLAAAPDALLLDTTNLTIDQALAAALAHVRARAAAAAAPPPP